MKIIIKISVVIYLFFVLLAFARAEVVYMNDGQVLQGSVIADDAESITLQTKFQTRKILRSEIQRVLYGQREMEPIFILTKDGSVKKGFLVDQDYEKVIIRREKNDPHEETIQKSDIKQMSQKEIVQTRPSIELRGGFFFPFDTGGAAFKPGWCVFLGSGFNLPRIDFLRLNVEAGYVRLESGKHNDQYMQIVPITLRLLYDYGIKFFHIVPRIGFGGAFIHFNDGEGETALGAGIHAVGGVGLMFEIVKNRFFMGVGSDYTLLHDLSVPMHCLQATVEMKILF